MSNVNIGCDVFLSHNSIDKPTVEQIAVKLVARGFTVWLDARDLVPGRPWQEAIEQSIATTRAAAVFIGRHGLGPWETPELRACLGEHAKRGLPVIPVLLPGAPQRPSLPILLEAFTWVDLRGGIADHGIDLLAWGITGERQLEQVSRDINRVPFQPGGRLREDDGSYVRRAADLELEGILQQQHAMVTIYGPRGIGKSSLMRRGRQLLKHRGYTVHWVDMSATADNLVMPLVRAFRAPNHNTSSDPYDELYSLVLRVEQPTALLIDEVDVIAQHQDRERFMLALRTIRLDMQEHLETRFSLILASAVSPSMLISSDGRGVYDVGRHLRLRPFDLEGSEALLAKGTFAMSTADVLQAFRWTGGHPGLLQRLAIEAEANRSLASALLSLEQGGDVFGYTLRHTKNLVEQSRRASEAVSHLAQGRRLTVAQVEILDDIGIIQLVDGKPFFANLLYERSFARDSPKSSWWSWRSWRTKT